MEKISFKKIYNITEQRLKKLSNPWIEVWHLGFPDVDDGQYHIALHVDTRNHEIAEKVEWRWTEVLKDCVQLHRMGLASDKFSVFGSTTHAGDEIKKHLESLGE